MLLRRITQHVKSQNWFAVFIDFIIVVVGVFIGIQVNNWNEARTDKANSAVYLQQIKTDIESSLNTNAITIRNGEMQIEQLDLVLQALESCNLSDKHAPIFAAGIYNLGKYNLPEMVTRTLDELNSIGKFTTVGTQEVRNKMTETKRSLRTILNIDSQVTSRAIPSINYVRSFFRFSLDEHIAYAESIAVDKVQYDFEQICTDDKLINSVALVREMTMATKGFALGVYGEQEELLELINVELDN